MNIKNKLNNLIGQLSESEQQHLADYIEGAYTVEFTGEAMMRDDIFEKIKEGLHVEFEHLEAPLLEDSTFLELDLEAEDLVNFSVFLMDSFSLLDIEFRKVMEWSKVGDMVSYIEDSLPSEPYISNFEVEA